MLEPGTTVWRYQVRNGRYLIEEGTVSLFGDRYRVAFTDGGMTTGGPRKEDIGVVRTHGPILWLLERDDEKARRLIIEYEERTIAELEQAIANKRKILEMFGVKS